ncbi:helix-turn-helix domain-containing protein [Marinospirillum sp.]|uniref:helix-turn-helix domain-containing protein n=1 Tax=Marinospirillum sp. TaxID=2183934 RepID=UPI003A874A70
MNQDLALNLRLLCSYYRSIAEVCRRLEINRPQFNRYLSGRYRPSASTLRRFGDFFGVEVDELLLPHAEFRQLIQVQPRQLAPSADMKDKISAHLDILGAVGSQGMERYLGYYYEYYLSMSVPGKVLRNLVCIERQGDQYVFQRTERMPGPKGGDPTYHNRYQGLAWLLTDRLFLVDYETLNRHEMTQTILFLSFRKRLARLTGLKLGVSDNSERMPCCARVVYEYLGQEIQVHRALSRCGLFLPSAATIDPWILEAVQNTMSEQEVHFRARHE